MSLRNQPYIPLYVQDFLTDEKLIECSAESTGVYIRLICILHKSETYGSILLKQKDKPMSSKSSSPCFLFACKLAKQMPYSVEVIERSLEELKLEEVICIETDILSQKRMIKDNEISVKRAIGGSKGGKQSQAKFAQGQALAKVQASPEYENEYLIKEDKSMREEEVVKVSKESKSINVVFPDSLNTSEFHEVFKQWIQHRKQLKKPATVNALNLQLKKLEHLNSSEAIKEVEKAIERGWQSFFPEQSNVKVEDNDSEMSHIMKAVNAGWAFPKEGQ